MKVIVTGDRYWANAVKIVVRLASLPEGSEVIQGGCRGADRLARQAALDLGLKTTTVEAEWDRYGRGAGPKRNQEMLDLGPDLVIAFHSDLSKSRGTRDMVRRARAAGVPVEVIE